MALTFSAGQSFSDTTNAASYALTALTPAVGDLLVVAVIAGATVATPGLTDNQSGTYYLASSNDVSGDLHCIFVREQPVASAVSHTLTFTCTGDNADGCAAYQARYSGSTRFGANAVRQVATPEEGAGSTTPNCDFSVAPLTGNAIFAAVANASTTATVTQPTGFTERYDGGYATPSTGLEVATLDSGHTATQVLWGSTSATAWGALAVELIGTSILARFNTLSNTYPTDGTSFNLGTVAVNAGHLVVVAVGAVGSNVVGALTDNDGSGSRTVSYDLIRSETKNGGADRLHIFVRNELCATGNDPTLTFTCTGDTATCVVYASITISGSQRAGAYAVRQSAFDNAGTPTPTFASNVLVDNAVLGALFNASNPAGVTPPAQFTEYVDIGDAEGAGLELAFRGDGFTSNNPTWGTSPSTYVAIAIELDSSAGTVNEASLSGSFPFAGSANAGPVIDASLSGTFPFAGSAAAEPLPAIEASISGSFPFSGSANVDPIIASRVGSAAAPTDFTGDYDPNNPSGVLESGGILETLIDLSASGIDFTQGTSGDRPSLVTYSGRTVVEALRLSGDHLEGGATSAVDLLGTGSFSIIYEARVTSPIYVDETATAAGIVPIFSTGDADSFITQASFGFREHTVNGTEAVFAWFHGVGAGTYSVAVGVTFGDLNAITVSWDGSVMRIRKNKDAWVEYTPGTTPDTIDGPLQVLKSAGNTGYENLGRARFFDRAISDAESNATQDAWAGSGGSAPYTSYAGSANASPLVDAALSGTFPFTGSASVDVVLDSSLSGDFPFAGSASVDVVLDSSLSGDFPFAGSAAADPLIDASFTGTFPFTGSANAEPLANAVDASFTGTFPFAGSAAADPLIDAALSGGFPFAGSANADAVLDASLTGTFPFAGSADVSVVLDSSLSGDFPFAGSAAADPLIDASLSGSFPFAGSASVDVVLDASLSGTFPFAGSFTVENALAASVSGDFSNYQGSAAADPLIDAALSGTFPFTGGANVDVVNDASFSGTFPFAGSFSAGTTATASVAGVFSNYQGSATTDVLVDASLSGAFPFTGSAGADPLIDASLSGAFPFTGSFSAEALIIEASLSGAFPFSGSAAADPVVDAAFSGAFPFAGSAAAGPDAPPLLTAAELLDGTVNVSWSISPGAIVLGFTLRRSTTQAPTSVTQGQLVYQGTATRFIDVDVTAGVKYFYTVFVTQNLAPLIYIPYDVRSSDYATPFPSRVGAVAVREYVPYSGEFGVVSAPWPYGRLVRVWNVNGPDYDTWVLPRGRKIFAPVSGTVTSTSPLTVDTTSGIRVVLAGQLVNSLSHGDTVVSGAPIADSRGGEVTIKTVKLSGRGGSIRPSHLYLAVGS